MKNWYLYILPILMLLPVFLLRDYTVDNELRYLSIADEALRDGSLFAFHNHGAAYADKPPLYFWFMMAFRSLTGTHCMALIGLLTIVPAIVIMYIMNLWCFGRGAAATRIAPPMLALLTCVMFAGGTVVLRMDMLMTMFIVLALYSFWKIYTKKESKADRFLLPVWIFLAVFSKGAVGILMPVTVIVAFLVLERKTGTTGRYLGWRTWGIIAALAAAWFAAVYMEGGSSYLDNLLFKQTVGRGVNSFHHKEPVWYYLKTIWYSAAPWSLFVAVMFVKIASSGDMRRNPLLRFFMTTVVTTFVIMSLVSSKIDIYLLPIYPFFIYAAFLAVDRCRIDGWIKTSVIIPSAVFSCVFPALFFCRDLLPVIPGNIHLIYIGGAVLSLMAAGGIVMAVKGHVRAAIASTAAGMLLCIFCSSFTLPCFNPYIGVSQLAAKGVETAESHGVTHYAYYKFRGDNMDVFIGKELTTIDEFDDLVKLEESGTPTLLFVRGRELRREEELGELLKKSFVDKIGDYSIYLLNDTNASKNL